MKIRTHDFYVEISEIGRSLKTLPLKKSSIMSRLNY